MDRREFTKVSLLGIGALSSCSSIDIINNGIDCHCHIQNKAKPGKEPYTFQKIQKVASPNGIQRFVVVVIYEETNESYVLKMKHSNPGKVGIISLLDPNDKQLKQKMVSNRNKGILGYRLNSKFIGEDWLKSESVDNMWKLAADLDVSICLLRKTNASLKSMKPLMDKYKSTKVVIDHLGLVDPSNPKEVDEFMSFSKYENCYVKVSRFFTDRANQSGTKEMLGLIQKVHSNFGSERLMWGSNAPVEVRAEADYKRGVDLIKDAPFLKPNDLQNIFIKTSEKLFF